MDPVSALASHLPDSAKKHVAPLYFRYNSFSANREHLPPSDSLARRDDAPSHVLVVVIDALRPDLVPDLPIESTFAVASAPWTFPSVASLHTGLRPSDHGSIAHTHPDDEALAMPTQTESHPHFPRDLERAGYDTYTGCGFITPFLSLRGWYQTHRVYRDAPAADVIDGYRSWRRGRDRTAAYLHLGDLHAPVDPPTEYVDRHDVDTSLPDLGHIIRYATDFDADDPECANYREQKLRLHRAALDYVSDRLARLLETVGDDTLVVITGDHGEALWEHQDLDRSITDSRPNYCFGHGGTPFCTIAQVPLLVSDPTGRLSTPDGGWPSLRDVPATVLDSVVDDVNPPGRSWHDAIPDDRDVICEGARYGVERKAIYRGEHKLIRSRTDDVTLTARVSDDEEEFVELPASVTDELLSLLPDRWEDLDVRGSVSAFTEDQLKALGYQ